MATFPQEWWDEQAAIRSEALNKFYSEGGVSGFKGKKHTDKVRKLISNNKINLYKEKPEIKELISKALTGRPGRPHKEEHKKMMSHRHSGINNPMYGVGLWDNPAAQSPHNQKAYSLMPQMFEFYKARKHRKRGWGYKAFASYIGWEHSSKALITPMKWVIENGDPRNDNDWLLFYAGYMDKYGQET